MKHVFVCVILMSMLAACSLTRKSKSDILNITVINKMDNLPVDSAQVVLVSIIDSRDVYEHVKFTNKAGQCSFSLDHNTQAQYQVRTSKKDLLGYYDSTYSDLDRANAFLNNKSGNDIILYLTSDSLNQKNFWASREVRYNIDTLINILKSNKYPLLSEFPSLIWDDIPGLLAIGNNKSLINKYPISVVSSSYQKDCYLGIIALWFIESIRITELKKSLSPNDKFPSHTPSLRYSDIENPELTSSIEIMEKAYHSYITWWDKVKDIDKQQACKINPLENTNIKW